MGIPALGNSLVTFKSAATLEAEKTARAVAAHQAQSAMSQPVYISSLAGYIEKCWAAARQAKLIVERQMMVNLRQRNGLYEADKLAAIRQMGGSEVYVLLTSTKCRAAEAWVNDILRPVGERLFGIKPTPIADLPPDKTDEVYQEASAVYDEVVRQAEQFQEFLDPAMLAHEVREFLEESREKAVRQLQEEAEEAAERMATKIDDQLAEGGWYDAFWASISDLITLKAGIIKGPVLRRKKVQSWVKDPATGKYVVKAVEKIIPTFERVSPFDLYPAPDSRDPDDGYLIERHELTRSELQSMIGVPGYSEAAIRKVLQDYPHGYRNTLPNDVERARVEFSGNTEYQTHGEKLEALEFWGSVQGRMLIEWGLKDGIDPDLDYEVNAWKIGNYVIRAILNPDKLGRKPYSVDSFERIPGSFWGKGLPELMADLQDVCNALARAIVNNAALASGPQVEVNIDRVTTDSEAIWPWKIWQSTNQQMSEAPAVRFNQPTIIVEPLLRVFDFFATLTEDQTGIPRWAYGNTNIGGAGSTSSGLSMLMTSASRGVKELISHIDNMTSGIVERTYDYNMVYDEDESIKGDCKVIARGSSALLAKEQLIQRTNEFLAATNNPTDIQITGIEGRAKLLKFAARSIGIDVEDVIPDKEGLKALVAKIEAQQAAMMQAGQQQGKGPGVSPPGGSQPGSGTVPQEAPATLDPAGNPAGGVDANAFQNQPGVTPG